MIRRASLLRRVPRTPRRRCRGRTPTGCGRRDPGRSRAELQTTPGSPIATYDRRRSGSCMSTSGSPANGRLAITSPLSRSSTTSAPASAAQNSRPRSSPSSDSERLEPLETVGTERGARRARASCARALPDLVLAPGIERVVDRQRLLELAMIAQVEQVEALGDAEQATRLRGGVAMLGEIGAVHDPGQQRQRGVAELVVLE